MSDIGAAGPRTRPAPGPRSAGVLPQDFFKAAQSTRRAALSENLAKINFMKALGTAASRPPARPRATAHGLEGTAIPVVHFALLRIVQHIVRFLQRFEFVFGRLVLQVHVRMELSR